MATDERVGDRCWDGKEKGRGEVEDDIYRERKEKERMDGGTVKYKDGGRQREVEHKKEREEGKREWEEID